MSSLSGKTCIFLYQKLLIPPLVNACTNEIVILRVSGVNEQSDVVVLPSCSVGLVPVNELSELCCEISLLK
jgi:hypothetical protein